MIKHLTEILKESLLDNDDILIGRSEEAMLKQLYIDWQRLPKQYLSNIHIVDGKILFDQNTIIPRIYLNKTLGPMPKSLNVEFAGDLNIQDQQIFDDCRDRLPKKVHYLNVEEGIQLYNYTIETEEIHIRKKCKIKNLTLNIPFIKHGLNKNVFIMKLDHLSSIDDVKEVKINSKTKNIIVDISNSPLAATILYNVKYDVNKWKKKNPDYTDRHLQVMIIEFLKNYLLLDYIDKYWEGVRQIVIKDKSGQFQYGEMIYSEDDLKLGDFIIHKPITINGSDWEPYEKMFRK